MKKLLKFVDRKIVGLFLLMVVVFTALNFTWVRSASTRLEDARVDKAAAEKELNELRSRLSDARADGVTSADALLSRVQRLEALLPFGLDDIGISQLVIASAESSGVILERFQPSLESTKKKEGDAPEKDPNVVGGLKSYRYDFKVTGPYLAVTKFLNSTVASKSVIVTFDGLYFYSAANTENPTIFDESVTAEGVLLVWTSMEKHLGKNSEDVAKPADDANAPADQSGSAEQNGSDGDTATNSPAGEGGSSESGTEPSGAGEQGAPQQGSDPASPETTDPASGG